VIGRARIHTAIGDGVDPHALHVFIPGALAGGFLISIGLLIGDFVRKVRGDAAIERRVTHTGAAVADEVLSGAGAAREAESGLRPRWVYGLISAVSLGLALLVIPGATWNYVNPGGYIADISWIWAVSMILAMGFGVLGFQTLRLAPEWIPLIIGLLGLGMVLRFLLGNESPALRTTLVVIGLVGSATGIVATWGQRRHAGVISVPPGVRPILARTPLSRPR